MLKVDGAGVVTNAGNIDCVSALNFFILKDAGEKLSGGDRIDFWSPPF